MGAPRKRAGEKPPTPDPPQFVFHVLVCNNFQFYEGYFLKLPQHDGNICGAVTQDVAILGERLDKNLLPSDSYMGFVPGDGQVEECRYRFPTSCTPPEIPCVHLCIQVDSFAHMLLKMALLPFSRGNPGLCLCTSLCIARGFIDVQV